MITLLQRLGRELDLVITLGSIERAREATQEAERRRELVAALEEALGDLSDLAGDSLPGDPLADELRALAAEPTR